MINELRNIDELMTAGDVRRMLRCSLALVYRMADRNQIPSVRWVCPSENGGRPKTMVRFKKDDVLQFIEKNYQKN